MIRSPIDNDVVNYQVSCVGRKKDAIFIFAQKTYVKWGISQLLIRSGIGSLQCLLPNTTNNQGDIV